MVELALFPLQSVLLPSMPLGLQVFEPRYLRLLEDIGQAGDRFGVVMITRGSEVGGDDQRANVGTVAHIQRRQMADNGRWLVEAIGVDRFVVQSWLPDDPYPRAEVELVPHTVDGAGTAAMEHARLHFQDVVTFAGEQGVDTAQIVLADNSVTALYQMAAMVPIADFDRYQVLAAPSLAEAAEMLGEAIRGAVEILRAKFDGSL